VAAGAAAGAALAIVARPLPPAGSQPPVAIEITAPPNATFVPTTGPPGLPQLAVSPDARSLAFVVTLGDGRQVIGTRPLNRSEVRVIQGTEGALFPFWSPDSPYMAGAAVVVLCGLFTFVAKGFVPYSVFRLMNGGDYFLDHRAPWTGLALSVVVGTALIAMSTRLVARRDF
jgi:hypothetical protein